LTTLRFVVLVVVTLLFYADLSAQIDSALVQKLAGMVDDDQHWRGMYRVSLNNKNDSVSQKYLYNQVKKIDSLHFIDLQEMLNQYGFVGFDNAGKAGAHNFWFLVQHQDKKLEFQLQILNLMKNEISKNNASILDYAYLKDRVFINRSGYQIYGTQLHLNSDSSSHIPKPLLHPNQIDSLRKTVGLPPMDFYINAMNNKYFGIINEGDSE
jgi:hypothetical protein